MERIVEGARLRSFRKAMRRHLAGTRRFAAEVEQDRAGMTARVATVLFIAPEHPAAIAQRHAEGSEAVGEDRLAELLAGPRAVVLAAVGMLGLLFILYLMFFKPF
jgi:hypothetical protein